MTAKNERKLTQKMEQKKKRPGKTASERSKKLGEEGR